MKNLVSDKSQVEKNIEEFNRLLNKNSKKIEIKTLVDNIPHVRAWYVYVKEGRYYFGPSKYIGYKKNTPEYYCKERNNLDGRMTEKVLSNWYEMISNNHPDYPKLNQKLHDFCSMYGKTPNSLFRINISLVDQEKDSFEGEVVELIWKIFLSLDKKNKEFLKSKINKYNSNN